MKQLENIEFEQLIERGCGMDVHKETVVATIKGNGIKPQTRTFKTFTNSLLELHRWLKQNMVTHIAIESTGVYWKPIFNIFGDDFIIFLVNARHIKNIPGHKTDKKDSSWLAKLLLCGLLKPSFIPPRDIRDLRDLTRYRIKLRNQITAERNRIEKLLEDTNIKISVVLSETYGVSGTKIINALINGINEPKELVKLISHQVKASRQDILEALNGHITDHHIFMLKIHLENIANTESLIKKVESQILIKVEPYKEIINYLDEIPGVGQNGAIGIISEIGVKMEQFPDHSHLSSWAGMSPGNNESAGKNKSGRINFGNKYLRALLTELAWAASLTKGSYLNSKYKSLIVRKGKKKAVIAIGHKILIYAYYIIKNKVRYSDLGPEYLTGFRKDKLISYYKKQLSMLDPNVN